MLDNLREQASDPDFFSGEDDNPIEYSDFSESKSGVQLFFGMTPLQRFVIAVLIFLMVTVMGAFALLVTEKVFLPLV
jgi:hypothetical protein